MIVVTKYQGNHIKDDRMVWAYGVHGVQEMFTRVLVEKLEEKVPLERPTYRWKDNNRTNQETGWDVWISLI